jgi:hypothetical protein
MGQVVVRNSWIGVNYVDLQHRAGRLSGITGAGRGSSSLTLRWVAAEAPARLGSRAVLGKSSSRPELLRETPDVLGVRVGG